jgi:AcrR family transcriptional regulator
MLITRIARACRRLCSGRRAGRDGDVAAVVMTTSFLVLLYFRHTLCLNESQGRSARVSPRPYRLGRRQADINDGRRRILDAARGLLAESTHYTQFTVGAVAERADIARATVYYQFGSKTGLLEALCDSFAQRGGMSELAHAFTAPDPDQALRLLVTAFARFWGTDRLVMRRLRALAALDADVAAVITARDDRRRVALKTLLERRDDVADPAHALRLAHMLTSFETYDTLLSPRQRPRDAVPTLVDLITTAIRMPAPTRPVAAQPPPVGDGDDLEGSGRSHLASTTRGRRRCG